jgi:hypothetical protein
MVGADKDQQRPEGWNMKSFIAVAVGALLAGCSSTGIVPADQDTYFIAKKSAAGVFGTPDGVRADIYREANAFCDEKGLGVETVTTEAKGAIPFVRTGSATLTFRCVPRKPPATVTGITPG